MSVNRLTAVLLIVTSLFSGVMAATLVQERKTKQVTRVKRPVFTQRDWDGIYFENLFTDGLVGKRPAASDLASNPSSSNANSATSGTGTEAPASGGFAWSKTISRSSIEDEIKNLQLRLAADITTPVKFKSDYAKVNQSFSILSMLFAIIREYDGEVRWQKDSGGAQVSFERAAANSRVGTIQAYESCKRRKDMLEDLVRGGSFVSDEKTPDSLDWSVVVDRTPLMGRLQVAYDQLKKLTASSGEFTREISTVLHESEMVAVIGHVLVQEGLTDADDESYAALAGAMQRSAAAVVKAAQSQDFDAASKAANLLGQSCDNCHADWR